LADPIYNDETKAWEHFEATRWPNVEDGQQERHVGAPALSDPRLWLLWPARPLAAGASPIASLICIMITPVSNDRYNPVHIGRWDKTYRHAALRPRWGA
jgi:hypothetical protein